jgi:hypothetical protein
LIRISVATFGLISALLLAGSTRTGASGLLANGGFEQGAAGWSTTAGSLDAVGSPVLNGQSAGRFSGSGQPTTQLAYQFIGVQPAQAYELSGWVATSGDAVSGAFLRISWFDANGQQVQQEDSLGLPARDGHFYRLTTGSRLSPAAAYFARASLYVLGSPNTPFEVHLDDFAFSGPPAIPPPPPTAPPATPPPPAITPTPRPPAVTPTRTPRRTATAVRTPAPQNPGDTPGGDPGTADEEPTVFQQLVNGGFEESRPDGSPFGWRKQGGEMSTVHEQKTEGSRAAVLTSQTTSTKWIHQTVSIRGGAHYIASADAKAAPGAESVFLRVSWYASADGSGSAIDSVDSLETAALAEEAFKTLTTGVVEAPAEAATVKVRLMLRPASETSAAAYFDSVSLMETTADVQIASRGDGSGAVSRAGAVGGAEPAAETGEEQQLSGGAPVRLANVTPEKRDERAPVSASGGGSDDEWAILLAIGIAVMGIGIGGGHELWQRRRRAEIEGDDI